MLRILVVCVALGLALGASGCASRRPVLYPNDHYQAVGTERAQADIAFCTQAARSYAGSPSRTADTAGRTATGAAAGAVVGGAVGAVVGSPGRGAAAGAAGGGSRGLLGGLFDRGPDPIERRFVEQCLRERGYRTLGWR